MARSGVGQQVSLTDARSASGRRPLSTNHVLAPESGNTETVTNKGVVSWSPQDTTPLTGAVSTSPPNPRTQQLQAGSLKLTTVRVFTPRKPANDKSGLSFSRKPIDKHLPAHR